MPVVRALLVVNPVATTTSPRTRDVITNALAAGCKLEVAETKARGHARELAAQAAYDGLDVVAVLGGDGTVNEVVNGLLESGPSGSVPDLAVVPGGSTNVLARSLGLPRDPVEATSVALDALREDRRREIGLGRADGRWFTFSAGLGLDAEVVARVEELRARGRRSTGGRYVRVAVAEFFRTARRRDAPLTLTVDGGEPVPGVHLALVTNTSPWTYLGERTVDPTPRSSFDAGLDALVLTGLGLPSSLRQVRRMLAGRSLEPRGRHAVAVHDATRIELVAQSPLPVQLDGDHLGEATRLTLEAVPKALRVVC